MLVVIQPIGKQLLDRRTTKMPRRQANAVNDQQLNAGARGTSILIGRGDLADPRQYAVP